MIDKLPNFDEKQLSAIEGNANRLVATGNVKQQKNAERVLLAIIAERQRRKDAASAQREQHIAEIAEKVGHKGLFEKVLLAFTEMPPQARELAVLREIASNPDSDGTKIARAIGTRSVGSINLLVGKMCSAREVYLGVAPLMEQRKLMHYSALIIDFIEHAEPSDARWSGWTLKPEAHAALKQLGMVE